MRTIYCGQINTIHIGKQVTICGWVNSFRNFGNIMFIEIRDREGLVQVFFDCNTFKNVFKLASQVRNEFCVQIAGIVRAREEKNINLKLSTGTIEIVADYLKIINKSKPLPLDFHQHSKEETYLKYRYLDLRRLEFTKRLMSRSKISHFIRCFMHNEGFLDIETPILTKTTPEGARDYLVPSRIYKGKFYSLPQSPQLFKQLLMIGGLDRYYQIVKCFRDEDLRSDRQQEFTQIDIEASFLESHQIREITERLIRNIWKHVKGIDLGKFPEITFQEAICRYGSDKPDLRNPIQMVDISDILKNNYFELFKLQINDAKNRIAAICIPNGNQLSRKQINEYEDLVKKHGEKRLIYIKVNKRVDGLKGIQGSIIKFFNQEIVENILIRTKANDGDIIVIIANTIKIITNILSAMRIKLSEYLKISNNIFAPV
ncbi:MAG: aspartate--tRNA ligase, partial [Pantoea sp. Edef]|nr:aspartate--tRNA ligase [Pantoea sp. Edef]